MNKKIEELNNKIIELTEKIATEGKNIENNKLEYDNLINEEKN